MIPSEIRKELEAVEASRTLIMIPGPNDRPWLYPVTFYKEVVAPSMLAAVPAQESIDYAIDTFSEASKLPLDKSGRVMLPAGPAREELGKDVVLVGVREHLQIWRRQEWEADREAARQRRRETTRRFAAAGPQA